jgi:hypothetical protein
MLSTWCIQAGSTILVGSYIIPQKEGPNWLDTAQDVTADASIPCRMASNAQLQEILVLNGAKVPKTY